MRDVLLRAPADADFPALAAMRRDGNLQAMLLTVPAATDDEAVRAWIGRRSADENGAFRVIADISTGSASGFVQLTDIHHRNRCGTGGIALLPAARGKGLGRQALGLLHRLAHLDKGLDKLILYVRVDNPLALALYASAGYRTVGTLRDHFRDCEERMHDVLLLERGLGDVAA